MSMILWARTYQRAILILCAALFALFNLSHFFSSGIPLASYSKGLDKNGKRHIHLLIPGNKANKRICRTITGAIVNDYSSLTIINWRREAGDEAMNGYDMTTGKNWGIIKYLQTLPPTADDDLIIMIDAHDVSVQLPVDIAIQRYEALVKQEAERLLRQHGEEQVREHNLKTTIFMGAEKFCWPLDHSHPACYAVPESVIRRDAYGPRTDQSTETNRPRWLCSGTIIGPVGDLRKLYERAHMMWLSYDTWGGDQDYFNNIFGRQELGRHRLRGSKEWVFGFGEHYEEDKLQFPHMELHHTDYHLATDTTSGLFQSLNSAHEDLDSLVHGNSSDLEAKDKKHGTADIYHEALPFPEDLAQSALPNERGPKGGHSLGSWHDVRLYTNFHARSIPAILHHNGDKTRMDAYWQRQWWTGHGRDMLQYRTNQSLYEIKTDYEDELTLRWDDVCGEFDQDIFVEPVNPWE